MRPTPTIVIVGAGVRGFPAGQGTDALLSPETLADTDQAITKLVRNSMKG